MARHFRKHWRKYAIGSVAYLFVGSYFSKKFRERNTIRQYCEEAKHYGEREIGVLEKPKKITVFLNPVANKMDAKIQFMKYAAPLFHLSGYDVTIVESEYEGQIRTLMGYIDPDSNAIVVAGGDGTIMEVVNGLMRRWDVEKTRSIPIGIIPLGRENRFYSKFFSSRLSLSQVRYISEAAMDIIRGTTVPIHMMQLEPESGKTLYALSSIHWGVFRDSLEIKDRFKLFGKFRLLMSHVRTSLRGWPGDYSLWLWFPSCSRLMSEDSSTTTPPLPAPSSHDSHVIKSLDTHSVMTNQTTGSHFPITSSANRGKTSPTRLAERAHGWQEEQVDVVGFKLCLDQLESVEERLKVVTWSADLNKWDFVKQGWAASLKKPLPSLPSTLSIHSPELVLQPTSSSQSWLSIDGEPYEAMPLAVKVMPDIIRVFTK